MSDVDHDNRPPSRTPPGPKGPTGNPPTACPADGSAGHLPTAAASTRMGWWAYAAAVGIVSAATGVGFLIDLWLPISNISVTYLIAVLLTAIRFGRAPSIVASVLSFLAFNFFFTEPRFTLAIADVQNILTVLLFLLAAVITSNLAARLRAQMEATRLSARRTENLYTFNRRISAAVGLDDVLWAVVHHVAATMGDSSLVLMPQDGELEIRAGYPPEDRLDEASVAAARQAWETGRFAGRGSTDMSSAAWRFLPMRTGHSPVGVLGVRIGTSREALSHEQNRLLETLADQAAIAIERTTLVSGIEAARVAAERERLRAALLSSLSHDLRTPLVSILGAASSLRDYGRSLKPAEQQELVQTIQEEAERLNRFVQNLLDMTRIGSGALRPRADWVDPADVVGAALERSRAVLRQRRVGLDLDPALPLLHADPVLLEQVFVNLLDNACKYASEGTDILIRAIVRDGQVEIEVGDRGPGIPEADRERVFDMFTRVEAGDAQPAGTGLGLAICRGIVEAHGGTIAARPGRDGTGTAIVVRLPIAAAPDLPDSGAMASE